VLCAADHDLDSETSHEVSERGPEMFMQLNRQWADSGIVEVNCVPLSVVSVEFLLVAALGQPFEHGLTAATDRLHW
jgi:hypothetical protein